MKIIKPGLHTIPNYYHAYVNLVTEEDLLTALERQMLNTILFLRTIPAELESYRYLPAKWTLKEVVGHMLDTERIMAYRALRFSRRDATPLPGFDENWYAPLANTEARSLEDMISEFEAQRRSTVLLFKSMSLSMLELNGTANGLSLTVSGLGWIIAGHELHHMQVIRERYLG